MATPRKVSHFDYLSSVEAETSTGVWSWAKRLIDGLLRWRPFELMDVPIIDKPFHVMRVNEDGTAFEYAPEELGLTGQDLTGLAGQIVRVKVTEDGYELSSEVMESLRGINLVGKAGQFVKVNATEDGFTIAP